MPVDVVVQLGRLGGESSGQLTVGGADRQRITDNEWNEEDLPAAGRTRDNQ